MLGNAPRTLGTAIRVQGALGTTARTIAARATRRPRTLALEQRTHLGERQHVGRMRCWKLVQSAAVMEWLAQPVVAQKLCCRHAKEVGEECPAQGCAVKEEVDWTCVTTCTDWPFSQCNVELLRTENMTITARTTGLSGAAGAGKSSTAAVLARDVHVQTHFPDGIVWLAFGRERTGVEVLRTLASLLGGNDGCCGSSARC